MNYYPMPVIRRRGLEAIVREAAEKALDGCEAAYVTFDIDYVEVNQNYDVSDITAKFGAQAIFKFLMPSLFEVSPL